MLGQPCPRRVVERGGLHFVQQLADHGADPHHLRGFVNEVLELAGLGPRRVVPGLAGQVGQPRGSRVAPSTGASSAG